ncbi:MAG: flagellar protein FlaG [Gammaproteobacteria bacterium]
MNNEIQSSLVAKTPSARSSVTEGKRAADESTGETLPPAEKENLSEVQPPPPREEIEKAAQELTKRAAEMGRDLRFDVDDDSGVTVIKVIDPLTDEVVRQIPSEEAVDRARSRPDSGFNLINDIA